MTNGIVQRLTPFEQRHNLFIRHLVKRSKALQSFESEHQLVGARKRRGNDTFFNRPAPSTVVAGLISQALFLRHTGIPNFHGTDIPT